MDPLLALSVAQNVITANSLLTYITGPLILSLPSIFHTRTTLYRQYVARYTYGILVFNVPLDTV